MRVQGNELLIFISLITISYDDNTSFQLTLITLAEYSYNLLFIFISHNVAKLLQSWILQNPVYFL